MDVQFERGNTVILKDGLVTFLGADDGWAWVKSGHGGYSVVRLATLRKLPPPFAVVVEGMLFSVRIGEILVNSYGHKENAKACADAINAAFAARLAERDANIEQMRSALVALSKLGNGDRPGNSEGNVIAQRALEFDKSARLAELAKAGNP